MVCAREIAPVVPHADRRPDRRNDPARSLRGPGLLTPEKLRPLLIERARAEGFEAVRITGTDSTPQAGPRLGEWLDAGRHGSMEWMAERVEWRASARALWPDAKSVIVLGQNYGPEHDPRPLLAEGDRGNISVYARGDDYHDVVKGRLKRLAQWLAHKSRAEVKVFVDTAPVMEKPIAQAAGLGWQGRHTNLVSREFGSWLFLGSIFTTLDLEPDEPARDSCGSCRACLDACPTGAFPAPYQIDARRCISYLTIENKGPIPHEFRAAMGNRIYGCDDCLAACPWNKFAKSANELRLKARPELEAPALAELAALDDPAFRALFRKSPVKRIGRDRFLRNVLIAIGNSGDQALADHARRLIHDPAPIVRGAAVWALSRLVDAKIFAALEDTYGEAEEDPEVRREWRTARAA